MASWAKEMGLVALLNAAPAGVKGLVTFTPSSASTLANNPSIAAFTAESAVPWWAVNTIWALKPLSSRLPATIKVSWTVLDWLSGRLKLVW